MKKSTWSVVFAGVLVPGLVLGPLGCQEIDGECWPVTEDGQGAGAGGRPVVPGSGGYGVSQEPQGVEDEDSPSSCAPAEDPEKESDKGEEQGSSCTGDAVTADGATYAECNGACQSKCPPAGVNGFSSAVFKFTTTVPDDGSGEAGGWQVAAATLKFVRWITLVRETWTCSITVGMPLRTVATGTISAANAATITAGVATQASKTVMGIKPPLPAGIYCLKLKSEMASLFASPQYKPFGAKMM